MNTLTKTASLAIVFLALGTLNAADEGEQIQGTPAQLLVVLPDCCNTPDGMSLQPDNSIILSVPNFNNDKAPPLLMKITRTTRRKSSTSSPRRIPACPPR